MYFCVLKLMIMVIFFETRQKTIIAVQSVNNHSTDDIKKFIWLFGDAELVTSNNIEGYFFGPRREMITPWSTNAVEITQNMGV